jgi:hypothetical protein
MSFADCVAFVVKSRMALIYWLNLKDRNIIINLKAEERRLLNRIIKQYVNSISGVQRLA